MTQASTKSKKKAHTGKVATKKAISKVGAKKATGAKSAAVKQNINNKKAESEAVGASKPSGKPQFWLMKSEPDAYSIDQLQKDRTTLWEGVRNYQARNFMTQQMQVGDSVLFYHSNTNPPSVVGLARVSKPAEADPSAFDPKSDYYEPKAIPERPIWECVEVEFVEKFKTPYSLHEIKEDPKLKDMLLIRKGQRLSIQPVTESEFKHIVKMCGQTKPKK